MEKETHYVMGKPRARAVELLGSDEPACGNGKVTVERYKITIEKVDEDEEVIKERLIKLWKECDNWHRWEPLKAAADKYGLDLNKIKRGE